jgi:hypothetical protein
MILLADYIHITWIIIGLLNILNYQNTNLWKFVLSAVALCELYILIQHLKTRKLDYFIFTWRLVIGDFLFFPMFPIAIILPEYYAALLIGDFANHKTVHFYCALLFWSIAVASCYKDCLLRKWFYIIFLTISVMTFTLDTLYSEIKMIKLITVTLYIGWIIITILEALHGIQKSRRSISMDKNTQK